MIGCAAMHGMTELGQEEFQRGPTEVLFNQPFDKTWNATLNALTEFPITTINKEVGLITTDWKTQSAPFIFIMPSGGAYVGGTFRSEAGGSYSQKRERLNIRVKSEPKGSRVSITTSVEVYFNNSVVAAGMGSRPTLEWRPATSDSISEGKLLKAIENALTEEAKPSMP